MHRTVAAGPSGTGWPVRRQAAAIRAGMSPGGRNTGSSGSTTRDQRRLPRGRGQQGPQVRRLARRGPGPHRLLQQPQAHHVAQVADRAVDAGLVGEVGRPAGLGQHRRGPAPRRPATRCRRRCRRSPGPRRGHADHGGRGVVRADRDHRQPARPGRAGRRPRQQLADGVAGLAQRREQPGRDAEARQRISPPPRPGPARRAAGWWTRWSARRRSRRSASSRAGRGSAAGSAPPPAAAVPAAAASW